MKFIYKDSNQKTYHWKQCEKLNAPFIEISQVDREYTNIFYDVTTSQVNLEKLFEDIRGIYISYAKFFMCEHQIIDDLYEQYYFFNLIVKSEHAEFIAEALYDYLFVKLNP